MSTDVKRKYKRISWIDVAKGIGIIFVCMGHMESITTDGWKQFAAMFHMPLFFFLSGILYENIPQSQNPTSILGSVMDYTRKQGRKLILPYILWCLIYASGVTIENMARIFWGNNELFGFAGLWFLPVMFLASIEFYFLRITVKRKGKLALIGAGAVLSAKLLQVFGDMTILARTGYPFGLDISFLACGFLILGYLMSAELKKVNFAQWSQIPKFKILINVVIVLLYTGVYILSRANSSYVQNTSLHRTVMATADYGNYGIFIAGAVCGVFATGLLAYRIKSSRTLEYIGRNSLIYMVTNHAAITLIYELYGMIIDVEKLVLFFPFRLAIILVTIFLTLVLCTLAAWVIDKLFPILAGKS